MRQAGVGEVALTIVSFQEHVRGWMTYLNRAKTPDKVIAAYAELGRVLAYYAKAQVLPFDQQAASQFATLQQQRVRVSTLDMRIANIALSRNATLLTRNLRDFRKVPGLVTEDWTS